MFVYALLNVGLEVGDRRHGFQRLRTVPLQLPIAYEKLLRPGYEAVLAWWISRLAALQASRERCSSFLSLVKQKRKQKSQHDLGK